MKKEDQNTEYKQSWREEYLKWICGFANAEGGRMLIGVADDKKGNAIVSVADWKTLLETIPNVMRDTMGMIADVNHLQMEGKDVVEIVVPAYPVPISLRGVYYVRRGATNQRLSGPGLEAFLMRKRGLHWENLPCPRLKMKDISAAEIKHFKDLAIDKGRLDASVRRETKESFVTNLHLHGSEGLSYAAALLFTEKAEKWIPGAYVKIGKFGEDDSDLVYHDDVHGSLLEQAEKTLELIYFKYLKAKIWYENGEQRVPFPEGGLARTDLQCARPQGLCERHSDSDQCLRRQAVCCKRGLSARDLDGRYADEQACLASGESDDCWLCLPDGQDRDLGPGRGEGCS